MKPYQRLSITILLAVVCTAFGPGLAKAPVVEAAGGPTLDVDVAMDARTWRMDDGEDPFWPAVTGAVLRGDTFVVNGTIYPSGTLPASGFETPSTLGPDLPGGIGTWVCRGIFNFDWAAIMTGSVPHVTSTQFFYFNDGRQIVTDGPEGGVTVLRAIIGGAGSFAGATGDVTETPLGFNPTNLFNVHFAFRFEKQAPK